MSQYAKELPDIGGKPDAGGVPAAATLRATDALTRCQAQLAAVIRGSKAVLQEKGFREAARAIFDQCKETIGATSGYVALLSEDGAENEVLFLEAGGLPCDVDPALPMPIRGLRAEAYRTNSAVYNNDFMNSAWVRYMPKGHVILRNVMFSPLVLEAHTVGIIGLANKPGDFTDEDARIAAVFGELAAIALQNSRNTDTRQKAEQDREQLIDELKAALARVKRLSGLLPICAHCKNVRDDQGYWKQIDAYVREHSEAEFSHGICPDCAKKHYPEYDIYGK
ncbi:MAG: GAF domain-containing protein [Pseudomonadota bacterium]